MLKVISSSDQKHILEIFIKLKKGFSMGAHEFNNCFVKTIAKGPFTSVTSCEGCNAFTLHIGPMSFRMEEEIYESLCQMILENYFNKKIPSAKKTLSKFGVNIKLY